MKCEPNIYYYKLTVSNKINYGRREFSERLTLLRNIAVVGHVFLMLNEVKRGQNVKNECKLNVIHPININYVFSTLSSIYRATMYCVCSRKFCGNHFLTRLQCLSLYC